MEIKVDQLKKTYPNGTVALNGVDFSVEKGESVVVLGHNGSGKSTLFRCLTGFEAPTSGSVALFEEDITLKNRAQLKRMRKRVGIVFQHFNLIHNVTVFQNVLFGSLGDKKFSWQTLNAFASNELREKAMYCLDRVGLAHLAQRRADELSGGQMQRVAIARMLMQDPEIILADEPIASLDPQAGKEVMDLLWKIIEEENLTVLTILHHLEIAKQYGTRMIALKEGEKVLDCPVAQVDQGCLDDIYQRSTAESFSKVTHISDIEKVVGGI